jgi:acetoacetate decarboxylase
VTIVRYGLAGVGPYLEPYSAIHVRDPAGEMGFYIPYIYVTNDVAEAAGREVFGAPKKLVTIELKREYELIQGTLERPTGKRLLTLTAQPASPMDPAIRQQLLTPT